MLPPASKVAVILLITGLALPASADSGSERYAPSLVASVTQGDEVALVSWIPGPEVADYYNVYGVSDSGVPTPLASAQSSDLPARVAGGYSTYAVSGVKLGIESQLVYPLGDKCLRVGLDPPDVGIDDCPHTGGTLTSDRADFAFSVRA